MGFLSIAYGLTIHSDLLLPELGAAQQGDGCGVELEVRIGSPARKDDLVVEPPHDFCVELETAWLIWPDVGRFELSTSRHCREGQATRGLVSKILIHPAPDVDDATLRAFLLGPVLAIALYQRGFLVLHASSIAFQECDGKWGAVGFLGHSGAGKSTMVAALHARGHRVISDDIIAVPMPAKVGLNGTSSEVVGEMEAHPAIYPGYPQLRLWPQSLAALGQDAETLPLLYPHEARRVRCVDDNFAAAKLPLRCLYILGKGDGIGTKTLTPREAMPHLLRHSYCSGAVTGEERAILHQQCAALARSLPIHQLQRPRDLTYLDDVAAFIESEQGVEAPPCMTS